MNENYSPVALFVYNRLDHTRSTVESLMNNKGADKTEVFVFSDGPKSSVDNTAVNDVREYIKSISGFKSVKVIERETNYGLANSIVDGVTSICDAFGRVIVLEDDLVSSPYFLQYMNDALEEYENNERVMHISGYMCPIKNDDLPETFFYRVTTCWGWATWQSAWQHFDRDIPKIDKAFTRKMRIEFNVDGRSDFWNYIEKNNQGIINTWAIFWYASVFLRKGLCLHPARSYIENIGHDGSGTHCDNNNIYVVPLSEKPTEEWCEVMKENPLVLKRMKGFYSASAGHHKRLVKYIRNILRNVAYNLGGYNERS